MSEAPAKKSLTMRFLDGVERVCKKLPPPAILFCLLFLITAVVAWLCTIGNVSVVNPANGKAVAAQKFSELVYFGQWYTPLRQALSVFVDETQKNVTGDVKLKLYKGNIFKAGVWSDYSLYSEDLASFGESDYDQTDSKGFINLFGLPIQVQAVLDAKLKK